MSLALYSDERRFARLPSEVREVRRACFVAAALLAVERPLDLALPFAAPRLDLVCDCTGAFALDAFPLGEEPRDLLATQLLSALSTPVAHLRSGDVLSPGTPTI